MARKTIEELEKYKDELERKKNELEKNYCKQQMDEARIKLRVANPSSGIDSMLEVLKCLKSADSVVKSVHSSFSKHEFSAVLQIETKVGEPLSLSLSHFLLSNQNVFLVAICPSL